METNEKLVEIHDVLGIHKWIVPFHSEQEDKWNFHKIEEMSPVWVWSWMICPICGIVRSIDGGTLSMNTRKWGEEAIKIYREQYGNK
jgi:hypothetical protein